MLEFLLFLSKREKEIVDLVYKANFKFEENTPLCLLGEKFFGFVKNRQKSVVICTQNAKSIGGHSMPKVIKHGGSEHNKTAIIIRKALRHEAAHIAQYCNNGKVLDSNRVRKIGVNNFKADSIKTSANISGNLEKEIEAYWLQERPKEVIYALKKYCFNDPKY